ncbi:MAG: hypothetical protein LBH35_08800, partial [Treponema sp.]|nr:hypothetical protein [Treponema sp.]
SSYDGGGVLVGESGVFSKSGGVIYGYDSADPNNSLWNKAFNGADTWGHAVFYWKDSSDQYYRDDTLNTGTGGNIDTGILPPDLGAINWTKK